MRAAAQTSFVPCCQLACLPSLLSMGSDVTAVNIHRVTSHTGVCLDVEGEREREIKSISFKHVTCSAWSKDQSACLSLLISVCRGQSVLCTTFMRLSLHELPTKAAHTHNAQPSGVAQYMLVAQLANL